MTLRLNLGCGGQYADGWINVDRAFPIRPNRSDILTLDVVNDKWPWEPESVDGIVFHHVLCMLTAEEMDIVLVNAARVLKPGGVIRVSDASLERGVRAAIARDHEFFVEMRPQGVKPDGQGFTPAWTWEETVGFFITQGGARKQHLTLKRFTESEALREFGNVCGLPFGETLGAGWITDLDSRPVESWFAEAWK